MLFRRIIFCSLFVGVVAGLLLSLSQLTFVNPIIFAAEAHEVGHTHSEHGHETSIRDTLGYGYDIHSHGAGEEWAPKEGSERTLYTVLANVLAGIGFSAVLLALMSQLSISGIAKPGRFKGLIWGLGGFIAVFVSPAIGLPPEIPGVNATPVEHRQLWWVLTVLCISASLLLLVYGNLKFKLPAIVLAVCPYIFYVPRYPGPAFSHPDPGVVEALVSLHQQFLYASSASNLVFWLALGGVSFWVLHRWVLSGEP